MISYFRWIIVYSLIIFISIYVLLTGLFKLYFPFWSRQPVFHLHNIYYWIYYYFYEQGNIITKALPDDSKFYNDTIHFYNFEDCPENLKKDFVEFIGENFMPRKAEKYAPENDSIIDAFKNHNGASSLSLKIYNGKILACMTMKPIECKVDTVKMIINYVDFLCVHEMHRKKNYATNQIYTHVYKHQHKNKNDAISFFKRENKSNMIVPFTTYYNYMFKIKNWEFCYDFDQPNINIVFIGKENRNKFHQIFMESKERFDYCFTLGLGNIFHMIDKGHIKIAALMFGQQFVGYYVFINSYTTYHGVKSIEISASYKSESVNDNVFTLGFLISLSLIAKDWRNEIIFIENLSNNNIILKLLLEKYIYLERMKNALYFYNYAIHPKDANKTLCII